MRRLEINHGDVYGDIFIVKEVEMSLLPCGQKQRTFLCECSICGAQGLVRLSNLRNNKNTCLKFKQKVTEENGIYTIYTHSGRYIFDKRGYDMIKGMRVYKGAGGEGYASSWINGVATLLHRYIMNAPDNLIVDHKNRNTHDNRFCNLRFATKQQNCQNQKKMDGTTSKYKGVCFVRGKYHSKIKDNIGNDIFLGVFDDPIIAAKEYDKASIKYHGKFACNNKSLGLL